MNGSRKIRMAPKAFLTKCGKGHFYLQDRLSDLPDCIIISILSLLPMKEAARTSVLSCRWRFLWTYAIRTLDFDASLLVCALRCGSASTSLNFKRNVFIKWVNKVLASHNGPTIDEFRVIFDLDEQGCKPYLDSWISFALKKRVRRLELNLSSSTFSSSLTSYNKAYLLTIPLLENCKLDSLTCISLDTVNVPQEVFQYILSCCPLLECLTVVSSGFLENLKVSGPTVKLKHIKFLFCYCIQYIEISAPTLLSFEIYGPRVEINFKVVPSLVEASFSGSSVPFLYENLPQNTLSLLFQLRILALDVINSFQFHRFPKLRNLMELKLVLRANQVTEVLCFMSLLKAFPMLHRLSFKIVHIGKSVQTGELIKMKAKRPHKHLKVIELIGFRGVEIDFELISYIINNTVALEKIVIDPRLRNRFCNMELHEELEDIRTCARRLGEYFDYFPPGLELVVL